MNSKTKLKLIVLDFDGVVVESNNIKHQAFSEIFSRYPDNYQQLMDYHLSNDHLNRYDKCRDMCENILLVSDPVAGGKKWLMSLQKLPEKK